MAVLKARAKRWLLDGTMTPRTLAEDRTPWRECPRGLVLELEAAGIVRRYPYAETVAPSVGAATVRSRWIGVRITDLGWEIAAALRRTAGR